MYISLNWLSDWIDLDGLSPEQIAERLTVSCAEVEGLVHETRPTDRAVAARVLSVEPGADGGSRLSLDLGGGARAQATSRGRGVAVGDVVVLAREGFSRPDGAARAPDALVSFADLGLGEDDAPILCPRDAAPGTPLSEWIPARDTLVEIDNKSITHRPDLWGHHGFARELGAILRRPLAPLDLADLARLGDLPEVPLANEGGADCEVLTALALDVEEQPRTPLLVQARLARLGVRPMGLLVDAGNYVMLEMGQPTHAYDRDRVGSLAVRPAGALATFVTLDGRERTLAPEDLMVFDGAVPVGIAGIMGGRDSAIGAGTRRVVVEAAQFRAARVRRTAARLGLRTEASQRFEKSLPPAFATVAQARILRVLEAWGAAPRAASRLGVRGEPGLGIRRIAMPAAEIARTAGADIPDSEIDRILGALGFEVAREGEVLEVGVPPHRSRQDIGLPIDVVEEVLRVHGYANVAPQLPRARIAPVDPNPDQVRQRRIRRLLSFGQGWAEVQTYLWTDDAWLREIGYDPQGVLRLRNPIAPDKGRLRTTLVPNLLKVAGDNAGHHADVAVYEIGRVVLAGAPPHAEVERIAGVSLRAGRDDGLEAHYREVKGAVERIVAATGRGALRTIPIEEPDPGLPWQLPDLAAELADDTGPIGTIGVLHGPIRDRVAPGRQIVWFELALDRLTRESYPTGRFEAFSEYPGSTQDFSVLWRPERGWGALEQVLDGFAHPLVARRELVQTYRGKGLEKGLEKGLAPGTQSYTIRYTLADRDRTLDGEDLERFRGAFLAFLETRDVALR
ncbi:phenylalanine--tRNA ligase subunit beta [Salinarimonas chemoclinalis]|uniref:phenylalanine--tRNA ligase subunit beta n=1 Tax=Salinarimonas chemoclinalis TaxID=3241599 RepID=UPI003556AAE2